jgi:hypothetical protein
VIFPEQSDRKINPSRRGEVKVRGLLGSIKKTVLKALT